MQEMGWSYQELMDTPMHIIVETLAVLEARSLARKHMNEGGH